MIPVKVLLPLPVRKAFTYLAPKETLPGQLVQAPWRSNTLTGIVTDLDPEPPQGITLKEVTTLPPIFPQTLLSYIEKIADYTLTPFGLVLKMFLSGSDFKKWDEKLPSPSYTPELSPLEHDQRQAYEAIAEDIHPAKYQSFLLDGVTGSGKTEVYFHALEEILNHKKQALVMIPEIGLTQSWMIRFEKRFGSPPFLWHSDQTAKNKRQIWRHAYEGTPCIFVGTRSSLFLPYKNLGLIVVDEEHDSSFKQEDQVIYNARDMAILRAHLEGFPIVLSSATPSLESHINANSGKYKLLPLTQRYNDAVLPTIHIIDKRKEKSKSWIAAPLIKEIEKRLSYGEQTLLFLNRRGFAPITLCRACGHTFMCPGCSTSLVQHKVKSTSELRCHHCGFHTPLPPQCPECNAVESFVPMGPGVERVYEEISAKFPHARVISLTSDMSAKEQTSAWEAIYANEVDIIVGTQLLAKGHHIPHLTLVGVVDADMGLHGHDLRASEKTFQLLQQVAGRAGREAKLGKVFLQTYQPDHPLFHALVHYNKEEFLSYEEHMRQTLQMPPFSRMISLVFSGLREEIVARTANHIARVLRSDKAVQVLGPSPCIMARLKSRHRYRIILKAAKNIRLNDWLLRILESVQIPSSIHLSIDVDPINFK